jgi:hypothetical protein
VTVDEIDVIVRPQRGLGLLASLVAQPVCDRVGDDVEVGIGADRFAEAFAAIDRGR